MNAHRYPLRAATGEQLLQKRTRPAQSMGDKDKRVLNDPFVGPNQENSSTFANKKIRRDLSHNQPQQQPYKQGGAFKSNDMKLKKTNPRLASMKAGTFSNEQTPSNQRKGKQMKKIEGKDHQHQFMQYPTMMPQYPMQYPTMPPQMMPMGMQGMQFPMQQMNPPMVGYHQSPQIAEMQKQINLLSQMTYMQNQMHQMQHLNHENLYPKQDFSQMQSQQFRGSYFQPTEQPFGAMYGGFPPHSMPGDASEDLQEQEEYYEEDQDSQQQNFSQHSQDEQTNELQADRSDNEVKQQTKGQKKVAGGPRTKDVSKQSSPKRGDSDLKNMKDDSPARSKRNQSGENDQDSGKQAPNSRMRENLESRGKNLTHQQRNAQHARNSKKNKVQDIHDNRNIIDDVNNVRRTTRSMLNKTSHRKRLGQAKDSPKKKQPTPTQGKTPQTQIKQKSTSRSPTQTSPFKDKTPRKQNKVAATTHIQGSQDESSQQITQRETRYSSRLSSAKVSMNVNGKGLTDKQKVLQTLKEEIEAADFKTRDLNKKISIRQNQKKNSQGRQDSSEKRKTRAKASAVSKKTPTKDEMILFGTGHAQSQRSIQEKSEGNLFTQTRSNNFELHDKSDSNMGVQKNTTTNNPLLKRHRKEAQTEIVDRRYEEDMQNRINASKSVFQNDTSDEEDLPEGIQNMEKMYSRLQDEKERLEKQLQFDIMDEQQLKDMRILFGIPDDEVEAIKKKQDEYLQKIKDQQLLFGDEGQGGEVNEFSTPNPINVKKEPIKSESQNSEVKMTRVIADNRVIDVDQSKDIKTEQEEILLFNDNSTTQDHQMMMQQRHHIKEEMSKQNNQSALQAQDINIILEVQKPADSSSQDLKLEKGLHHDPSSTAGLIKQQKLTMEDERMLFSDDPINTSSLAANAHQKSSTLLPPPSISPLQQPAQVTSNANNQQVLLQNDLIAHEPDDTFKIDEEAAAHKGGRFPNIVQESQNSQEVIPEEDKGLQDLVVEERPSDHIESMTRKQENLRKQIELLQQQIDQDQKMIKEQNIYIGAQPEVQYTEEAMQNEDIEENHHHEEEMDEGDQIMQEHDEREFEVHLDEENNVTSNENQDGHIVGQAEESQPQRDITTLVDHLQLPDSYEQLATFVSALDQGLNILHSRQVKPTFIHLRQIISAQTQKNFTLNHVKQILSLQPNLYGHHWEFRHEKYDLIFQIPSNTDELVRADDQDAYVPAQSSIQLPLTQTLMRARVNLVRKLLLKKVYDEYCKFMVNHSHRLGSQVTGSQADHDIFVTRRWPGMFELNNPRLVPEIPSTGNNLKEQPTLRPRQETVHDFVQRNDHKEKIREAVEEANRMHQSENQSDQDDSQEYSDSSDEARRRSMKLNVQTGVKETTMAVVRMKDQMETKAKEKVFEDQQKNETLKNIEAHVKCSEQIKQIMSFNQGSTMKLRDLIQKLINSHSSTGQFITSQQIKKQIESLHKILPEWIRLTENCGQMYIKVFKNLNLQQHEITKKIQTYFNRQQTLASNLQASQDTSSYAHPNQKKRERLDSEQARMKQQVVERGNESQRMTKSCPPIAGPSQSQDQQGLHQHSAQERSNNQSALSQKSNSLSHRQQEVQSPNVGGNQNNNMPNLSNQQQQAHGVKKTNNQSAFQPYQKTFQSQSLQSHSENPLNHLQKSQADIQAALDSEMAVEQNHSLANMGGANPQYYGGGRPSNGLNQKQQHVIQPSTNSLFKQITPQSQRAQAVNNNPANNRNGSGENNGSSGTYLTGSCESAKNPHEQMEGGDNVQRANGSANNRFQNGYSSKPNGGAFGNTTKPNGIDSLLKQVMQNNGEHMPAKNYSPVKRDNPHQRHVNAVQPPLSSHQNIFDSNSISASINGPQFGNDLYQALASSSRGRGYSGSPYGAAPSHNTHHPSLLAMNDDEADDIDNGAAVHHHHLQGPPNLTNFRSRPGDYQNNMFGVGHQSHPHQQHSRNRMNSGDRDGGQHFGGRFNGQHGGYY